MELLDVVAIALLPGISRTRAALTFKALRGESQPDGPVPLTLETVIEASRPGADAAAGAAAARHLAAALLARAASSGTHPVPWNASGYPPLLDRIVDPPPVLWARGVSTVLSGRAVAIVGSRAATSYALAVAERLGGELAERGAVVVSGMARGVDGAAHRGCVQAGGSTVAVLGSGPDVIYPAEHRRLADEILAKGCLVSELGPGAPPLPEHFPQRNRLISGISLAVVVVEASENSGSLITARRALDQGREVMAVPGSVLSGRNRGSHALLKDGAKVVETADDILEELGWSGSRARVGGLEISCNALEKDSLLARLTPGETYDVDEISATVEIPGPQLLVRIAEWELQRKLVRTGGGRYRLA
jgi:DNA processing protein